MSNPHSLRAEAALELLNSLASAGDDPEQFATACADWTRLSNEATAMPEFHAVISLLSRRQGDNEQRAASRMNEAFLRQNYIELDPSGVVTGVSRELSEFLRLNVGDVLSVPEFQTHVTQFDQESPIVEITDRFQIARKLKLHPVLEQQRCVRIYGRLSLFAFSEDALSHLREEFALTKSEIEILQLTLRRLNLEQIAEWRGIKLSTVRTHVSRVINKLRCHSLIEAVTTVVELSNIVEAKEEPIEFFRNDLVSKPRRMVLGSTDQMIEYRRFGSTLGRPVVVLHSLEYGYMPSAEMIRSARDQNVNLTFPLRPGFGASSVSSPQTPAHNLIVSFIEAMDFSDVVLVGLSTAAPFALQVGQASERVGQVVLVNYGLNVSDKLKDIQPVWIRGMLKMALNSPASFKIGLSAIRSIVRSYGGLRFYKRLYSNQTADEKFLNDHLHDFEQFSDYLLRADAQSVRQDIVSAFLPNRDIENAPRGGAKIVVVNASSQHGVGTAESKNDAARLNMRFVEVGHNGRNWPFRYPESFFRHIFI